MAAKPGIGVLVAAMPKKDKGMGGDDGAVMDEKMSAKKALWKAIKADDFEGFSEALDLCNESYREPDGDEAGE